MFTVRVRRSPSHVLSAHVEEKLGGYQLVQVEPVKGPIPEWRDMTSMIVGSVKVIRDELLHRMKNIRSQPADEKLWISPKVQDLWARTFWKNVEKLEGIDPDDVPETEFQVLPSGKLKMFVLLPNRQTIEMEVPSDLWGRHH